MSAGTRSRIRPSRRLSPLRWAGVLIWLQPSGLYPWFKALHVIAIISWMAGMLYLPRLFIYHCAAKPVPSSRDFKVMEQRLLRIIINPAMVASWVLVSGSPLMGGFTCRAGSTQSNSGAGHVGDPWIFCPMVREFDLDQINTIKNSTE